MSASDPFRIWNTASSVTTTSTASRAVSGNVHSRTSFASPLGVVDVIVTIDTPRADDEVHCSAHAEHVLSRNRPVGDVTALADLERAEYGDVHMTTADHGEAGRAVEVGSARQRGDGALGGVDEVGIELVVARPRADAEEPVLRVEEDLCVGSEVSGDQVRDPDAEVDDLAGVQLSGRTLRDDRLRVGARVCHERATRWST